MPGLDSRVDVNGLNIPIDLQDRSTWTQAYINTANHIITLVDSFKNVSPGRFYYEALIAREHCLASHFNKTNWPAIVDHYEKLIQVTHSPVAMLNQAVALGYAGDTNTAIQRVKAIRGHKVLKNAHMPDAILAHLYAKAGDGRRAYHYVHESEKIGCKPEEYKVMVSQIERLLKQNKSEMTIR